MRYFKEGFRMIEAICNRSHIKLLSTLLAKERRSPIHIRMVSPHLGDFDVDGENLFKKLSILRNKKNASIVLLLDKKDHMNYVKQHSSLPQLLQKLEALGIRLHFIRNLHSKIILVENNQEKCLLVTSANLTHTAYHKNCETGIYLYNCSGNIYEKIGDYITHLIKRNNQ